MSAKGSRLVVGITGGIGSGKSTVANLFADRGATLVDTDVIAHELTAPGGEAIGPIRDAFGAGTIAADGALDRAAMRRLVFADPAARTRLEAILHPMIRAESLRQCERAAGAYVMLVVPLLVESGAFRSSMHRVLVVDCPEALQVERVMSRNGLTRAEVEAIMAAQVSRAERLAAADDVILNAGPLAEIAARVAPLHASYLDLAARLKAPC